MYKQDYLDLQIMVIINHSQRNTFYHACPCISSNFA